MKDVIRSNIFILILGSIWVFTIYNITPRDCDNVLYYCTFAVLIMQYTIICCECLILSCCGCCHLCVLCLEWRVRILKIT